MPRRTIALLAAAVLAAAAFWYWHRGTPAERQVRALFGSFEEEFNRTGGEGLGSVAHAARLGGFFTPDVVIELGQGSPPIHGRETLIGMAVRLQPRTAGFILELDDLQVEVPHPERASVAFTALIRRRSVVSGEESLDAREFAAEVVKSGGDWQISRVRAIDTLR